MTQCWSEGELRAYLDSELPPGDMQRVVAHLKECAGCGGTCAELEARAARLSLLLGALPEPELVRQLPSLPRRAGAAWRWAAGAVAAALVVAFLWMPKRTENVVVAMPPALPAPQARPGLSAPPAAPVAVKPAIIRRVVPVKPKAQVDYYVKLDDEPIETGIVVRVGLDGGQVPADVILGPDGRARAIRLVNDFSGER
jgi:anti-sigma factor RsiW